ncbi:MAG: hypothetical protein RSD32_02535 [Oscillospiraceae bacterium]
MYKYNCPEVPEVCPPPEPTTCPAVGYQKAKVCVPVSVAPFASPGTAVTKCCGEPLIIPGNVRCNGQRNLVSTFTVSQTILVEIPINFGANTTVGDSYIEVLNSGFNDGHCCCEDNFSKYDL